MSVCAPIDHRPLASVGSPNHLLAFLAAWFEKPALLQFARLPEGVQQTWLASGGSIVVLTHDQTKLPQDTTEEQAARFRVSLDGVDGEIPDRAFEVFYFRDADPLSWNITLWERFHQRLANQGVIVIESTVCYQTSAYRPGQAFLNDLWHDCPPSLSQTFQPSFSEWLQHRGGFQKIELPQRTTGQTCVVLQKRERHLGGAEARLCVASFGENLDWLERFNLDTCVYDATGSRHGLIPVPNIAREASQYLRHIIMHYGQFASHEIFIQGKPTDHNPNLVSDIARGIYRERSVRALGSLVSFDYSAPHQHDKWAVQLAGDLFGGLPHGLQWTPGAQFSASRQALQARSLDFWKMLLAKIEAEPDSSPWAIERLWLAIF